VNKKKQKNFMTCAGDNLPRAREVTPPPSANEQSFFASFCSQKESLAHV
jgi:hypothetical protein